MEPRRRVCLPALLCALVAGGGRRCAVLLAVAALGSAALGGEPLTLAQALGRTLERSPELRPFDPGRRALEAERLQAGLRPNPELSAELENFAGSGAISGTQGLETTLTLSQLVELAGRRKRRVGVAAAELESLDAEYAVARLDVLAETASRFTDVAEAQAVVEVALRGIALAEQAQETIERRVRAGATSTAERSRNAIALVRARLAADRARSELESRRVSLAAMWGDTAADFSAVSADLAQLPDLGALAPLVDQLAAGPELLRFAAERRLRQAELKLARAQRVPDLSLGAGARRLNESDDVGLVAGVSMPLPVFDRNQGGIAASRARIARTDALRDAVLLRSRGVLFGLYQAAQQARAQAIALERDAIPQAEEALSLTQRGYANGRFSFLDLADVQRQVLELREQVIAEQANAHRLAAEIERLTGAPVVSQGAQPPPPTENPGDPR